MLLFSIMKAKSIYPFVITYLSLTNDIVRYGILKVLNLVL